MLPAHSQLVLVVKSNDEVLYDTVLLPETKQVFVVPKPTKVLWLAEPNQVFVVPKPNQSAMKTTK